MWQQLIVVCIGLWWMTFMYVSVKYMGKPRPRWYAFLCQYLGERYCPTTRKSWMVWGMAALFNEMLFWEMIWILPFLYRLYPSIDLSLLYKWGWLLPAVERVLRSIVFGVGFLFVGPHYLRLQWSSLQELYWQRHKIHGVRKEEKIRRYISLILILVWEIMAGFASVSLLREAYELLRQGPTP